MVKSTSASMSQQLGAIGAGNPIFKDAALRGEIGTNFAKQPLPKILDTIERSTFFSIIAGTVGVKGILKAGNVFSFLKLQSLVNFADSKIFLLRFPALDKILPTQGILNIKGKSR